jgi:Kef-type K+ transport system membrane component KefB/nucleotide-binding universal stress UspA family protein
MRKFKYPIYFIASVGFFLLLILWALNPGASFGVERLAEFKVGSLEASTIKNLLNNITGNFKHPLALIILQIITILLVARILGVLFTRIGQPMVIGEIMAGIVLGPSILGNVFPEFSAILFPPESLQIIQVLSQIGLILFMFVIGMDLDISIIRKKASDAIIISQASIIVPFGFGLVLSYFLYPRYTPENIPFHSFALFICIALSITAFPVLARIIQERGWTKTHLGVVAITSAAVNDITAWCLLAIVIALVKAGSIMSAISSIVLAFLYVCFMIIVLKPFLVKMKDAFPTKETMNKGVIAFYFIILLSSAYVTELLGIHALFGAFMAGIIMPADSSFRKILIEKIEDISLILLLPLFFVYTGLRTELGLINEGHLWVTLLIIVLVAVAGKFFGSALSARFVGQSWRDSLIIGALMNTRGLMELVVLNIGYDLGVLPPQIFVLMVLMALITTFMTGPSINLIRWLIPAHKFAMAVENIPEKKILISYGPSSAGVKLLRLASEMSIHDRKNTKVTTLHFTRGTDLHPLRAEEYANESFKPLLKEAFKTGIQVLPKYKVTDNIDQEIVRTAERGDYDLLLIGAGRPIIKVPLAAWFYELKNFLGRLKIIKHRNGYSRNFNLIHEKARYILDKADCNVGVFIDRNFEKSNRIFLPIFNRDDLGLLPFISNFMLNEEVTAFIYDKLDLINNDSESKTMLESMQNRYFTRLHFISKEDIAADGFFSELQLMLISLKGWKHLLKNHKLWIVKLPSTLIIKKVGDTDLLFFDHFHTQVNQQELI